jgi:hypothetical protein
MVECCLSCEEDTGSITIHKLSGVIFFPIFLVQNHIASRWLLDVDAYLCAARVFAGVERFYLRRCPTHVVVEQAAKHCMQGEIQSAGVTREGAQLHFIEGMSFFYM